MKPNVIYIDIAGPVQVGKSALFGAIRDMLVENNFCVAVPEREARHNPPDGLSKATPHEKPKKDETVIILTESLTK